MYKTRREWAKWMAAKGIGIFAVEANTKEPIHGVSWYFAQTDDLEKIDGWFNYYKDCNYAAYMREAYVVIDLDLKPNINGIQAFESICSNHGLPDIEAFLKEYPTLAVKTPRNGYHLYFQAPFPAGNKNYFPAGIDVRGVNGYVVGPGCKNEDGEWTLLNDGDILPLPEFLHEYIEAPGIRDPRADHPLVELDLPENITEAEIWLATHTSAIEGQGGDNHTYETILVLRDYGLSKDQIFRSLNETGWNQRCDPPWSPSALLGKIDNAWNYGQNRPGNKAPTYQVERLMKAREVRLAHEALNQEQRDELNQVGNLVVNGLRLVVNNAAHVREDEVPTGVYPEIGTSDKKDSDLFPAYLVGELDRIPDPKWLIRDVLPEKALKMLYGGTGSLKTFLELDKALWGAVGQPWAASDDNDIRGFKVTRNLRSVIIAGEGASGLKRRIAAWATQHGIETKDLPILVIPVMPRFANDDDLKRLIHTIKSKLPNPDYIIVDTAMWAAAGLNLNLPADSQVLLTSFKQVMLALDCGLTFVHHTGKDKKLGPLGAENLLASVDVVDYVELMDKGLGRRKIKITNQKMKDGELRDQIYMNAFPESLGTDEEGRPISSLVLHRCHGSGNTTENVVDDPRLELAQKIIAENKGKMPLSMNMLAEEMARRYATDELTDGELEKAKERMRNYLRKAAKGELAHFAHKTSNAKNATWEFEDRDGR